MKKKLNTQIAKKTLEEKIAQVADEKLKAEIREVFAYLNTNNILNKIRCLDNLGWQSLATLLQTQLNLEFEDAVALRRKELTNKVTVDLLSEAVGRGWVLD